MIIRFKTVFITIISFLYFFIRGNAKTEITSPETFVVINPTGNIGDMVCTTPVFRAIKESNPDSRVIVMGAPKNQIMMEGNKDIDKYISTALPVWKLVRELSREKIDAGIVINFSVLNLGTLFLANVKVISCFSFKEGYRQNEPRPYKLLSRIMSRITYTPGEYVPGQYLNLLMPFGIESNDIRKHLAYSNKAEKSVISAFREKGIQNSDILIAIAPGAGTKIKQWPSERFGIVANHLSSKHNAAIAIIGGPRDREEADRMIKELDAGVKFCDFTNQSLDELKATLSMVDLIIGNDSGPIYIAESFGASTLVLIGPTDETEHPLQDKTHKIVMAENRGNALLRSYISGEATIDLDAARSQIESITTEQVCNQIDDLMNIIVVK